MQEQLEGCVHLSGGEGNKESNAVMVTVIIKAAIMKLRKINVAGRYAI